MPSFIQRIIAAWRRRFARPEAPKPAPPETPRFVSYETIAARIEELRRMRPQEQEEEPWLGRRVKPDDGWRRVDTVEDLNQSIPESWQRTHRRNWMS